MLVNGKKKSICILFLFTISAIMLQADESALWASSPPPPRSNGVRHYYCFSVYVHIKHYIYTRSTYINVITFFACLIFAKLYRNYNIVYTVRYTIPI